jgi:hypothetical protein
MNAQGLTAHSYDTAMGLGAGLASGDADRRLNAGMFNNTYAQNRRAQDIGLVGGLNTLGQGLSSSIPAMQAGQFALGNAARQNIVGAVNAPQAQQTAGYNNWQNYVLSLMGANPMPPGGTTTGTSSANQTTDWLGLAGGLASTAGAASRWF